MEHVHNVNGYHHLHRYIVTNKINNGFGGHISQNYQMLDNK